MPGEVGSETATDYRVLLEEEGAELSARLSELGVGGDGLAYDSNFADTSQVTAERGEVERLVTELKDALDLVEAALAKLANGTYGTCESCGGMISAARLEAKPAARFCIDCASSRR